MAYKRSHYVILNKLLEDFTQTYIYFMLKFSRHLGKILPEKNWDSYTDN